MYLLTNDFNAAQSSYFQELNEQFFNIETIKINSLNEEFKNTIDSSFDNLLNCGVKQVKVSFRYNNIIYIIKGIIIIFLLFSLKINGRIEIGNAYLLYTYILLYLNAIQSAMNFGKQYEVFRSSYDRAFSYCSIELDNYGTLELNTIKKIELSNVSFKYEDSDYIIKNYSYTFYPNKIYGIIGSNGAGKTTLTYILLGLYPINSGYIKYNNIFIKDLNMYKIRKYLISYADQNVLLINTSLENILSNEEGYITEKTEEMLKYFDLDKIFNLHKNNNIFSKQSNMSGRKT